MSRHVSISAGTPFSFDPIDYDAFTHHFTQRPVLATLVSNYRSGDIIGVLAKGWSVNGDGRVWSFEIRSGLTFSDGMAITPSVIKRSLTRNAALMRLRGSRSGLFEKVQGYSELTGPESEFPGMLADDAAGVLKLTFVEDPKGVLDKLSFGLYAVSHPADWDSKTGKWFNPRLARSSGPYVIESWTEDGLKLKRRPDFPLTQIFGNDRPFDEVLFVSAPPAQGSGSALSARAAHSPDWSHIDLVSGLKGEQVSPHHEFRGEAQNGILFLRVMGQENPESPLHAKELRESLRAAFYEVLRTKGTDPTTSFLPLAIPGTGEVSAALAPTKGSASEDAKLTGERNERSIVRICDYKAQSGLRRAALEAFVAATERLGLVPQVVSVPPPELAKGFDGTATEVACDAALILTSVLLATPWDDLKFMVHSREGIRLPDPTARLAVAMDHAQSDPQRVNDVIWDDALVWPILHATAGLWVNPNRVDTSLLDLIHPPTEVALIRSVE